MDRQAEDSIRVPFRPNLSERYPEGTSVTATHTHYMASSHRIWESVRTEVK